MGNESRSLLLTPSATSSTNNSSSATNAMNTHPKLIELKKLILSKDCTLHSLAGYITSSTNQSSSSSNNNSKTPMARKYAAQEY